jgi:hypothetical protein
MNTTKNTTIQRTMKDISIGGDPSLGVRVIVHIIRFYLLFITMNELYSSFLRTLFSV